MTLEEFLHLQKSYYNGDGDNVEVYYEAFGSWWVTNISEIFSYMNVPVESHDKLPDMSECESVVDILDMHWMYLDELYLDTSVFILDKLKNGATIDRTPKRGNRDINLRTIGINPLEFKRR